MSTKAPAIHRMTKELRLCRESPARFFERWLGIKTLYDKQVEILESVRDNPRTLVAACHSSGKTFLAGGIVWWWEVCHPLSITVTTAPTERQVKDLLWGEIRSHHGRSKVRLPGEVGAQTWKMPDPPNRPGLNSGKWYATGFATRPDEADEHASRFIGYHSDYVLVLFDEASGILRPIWKAAEGLFASGLKVRFLGIGNPLDPASMFASYYREPLYNSIRISAFDTPNFRPDVEDNPRLVSEECVEAQRRLEGEDSPFYVSKVLGRFPEGGDDTMIPLAWVSRALERKAPTGGEPGTPSLGVDVARFGSDAIAFYGVQGSRIVKAVAAYQKPTTWTAARAIEIAREIGIPQSLAHRIAVDDTGVGGGVTDDLRAQGWNVTSVDFGNVAQDEERFHDRRTELWWNLREWIETEAELEGAPYRARQRLEGDLSTPRYSFKKGKGGLSRRALETKEQMKKRLGRSPDDGDSLALALVPRITRPSALPPDLEEFDFGDDRDRDTGCSFSLDGYLEPRAGGPIDEYLEERERYHGRPYD